MLSRHSQRPKTAFAIETLSDQQHEMTKRAKPDMHDIEEVGEGSDSSEYSPPKTSSAVRKGKAKKVAFESPAHTNDRFRSKATRNAGQGQNVSPDEEVYQEEEDESEEEEPQSDYRASSDEEELGSQAESDAASQAEEEDQVENDNASEEAPSKHASEVLNKTRLDNPALEKAWEEIVEVFRGTEHPYEPRDHSGEANAHNSGSAEFPIESGLSSAGNLGKTKDLDVVKLIATLRSLEEIARTAAIVEAKKKRQYQKIRARNQAYIKVAGRYVKDEAKFNEAVQTEEDKMVEQSYQASPKQMQQRAKQIVSRNTIKKLTMDDAKRAKAEVGTEADLILQQMDRKFAERKSFNYISPDTIKAAGKLAEEEGFHGRFLRARNLARIQFAVEFVDDLEQYKAAIEEDCRRRNRNGSMNKTKIARDRKQAEIKRARSIVEGLDKDQKLAAAEEIDNLALAELRKRAKKKSGPQYLIDNYTVNNNHGSDDGGQPESQKEATPEDQIEDGDSDAHESGASDIEPAANNKTPSGSQGPRRSDHILRQLAGEKRKRPENVVRAKPAAGTTRTTRSQSAKKPAAVEEETE